MKEDGDEEGCGLEESKGFGVSPGLFEEEGKASLTSDYGSATHNIRSTVSNITITEDTRNGPPL